jgi:hypothetical protein
MKDTRGSEQGIGHKLPDFLEKEVIALKHSQMWKELEFECDRIIKNSQESLLTQPTFTMQELSYLQGVYSMAKKIRDWPQIFLSRQDKSTNG